jgi:hypothetical protein
MSNWIDGQQVVYNLYDLCMQMFLQAHTLENQKRFSFTDSPNQIVMQKIFKIDINFSGNTKTPKDTILVIK